MTKNPFEPLIILIAKDMSIALIYQDYELLKRLEKLSVAATRRFNVFQMTLELSKPLNDAIEARGKING